MFSKLRRTMCKCYLRISMVAVEELKVIHETAPVLDVQIVTNGHPPNGGIKPLEISLGIP